MLKCWHKDTIFIAFLLTLHPKSYSKMKKVVATMALLLMSIGCFALTKTKESMVTYHKIQVEDCNVFYREAGSPEKPAQR